MVAPPPVEAVVGVDPGFVGYASDEWIAGDSNGSVTAGAITTRIRFVLTAALEGYAFESRIKAL